MPWLVLILSGLLETVWALALAQSAGFTRLAPSTLFVAALAASMIGLGYAVRTIPIGTGYAVWVGIGAAGTAIAGMLFLDEPVSVLRILSLLLIFAGVIGLKVFH
jgi:quaternary ammonium compound-resistance protein SugE